MLKKLNIGLLFLNIFFLQSYLIRFQVLNYPTNLQEILIFAQIIVFILAIIFDGKFKQIFFSNVKNHWVMSTFILLTAVSILTVDITDNIYFIRHLRFLFVAAILSFVFIETLTSEKSRAQGIKVMGIGAVIFGIFSVFYNLFGYNITHDYRLLGPLDAAVYSAFYMAPFFIFFTIQFFEHRKKSDLIFATLLALMIIATRSMGTVGATFLVLTIYFFKKHGFGILKSKLAKAILAIVTVVIVGTVFYAKILPAIQTNYASLNERGEIWQTSVHFLKDPMTIVWGLGYGQFQNEYATNVKQILGHNPLDYYVLQPHNIFFLFIFQYGILGLLFLVACIARTIKNLKNPIEKFNMKTISNFIILYFLIHGMIDTPFFKNDILFLLVFFFELGLSRKIHYLSPDTKSIKTT
ncbi:MAG: O-antigen ligase family protein [Candidatus Gracilibacteria bacterium]|jgi:O-antigen ligase